MRTITAQRLCPGQVVRSVEEPPPFEGWVTVDYVDHDWNDTMIHLKGEHDPFRVSEKHRFQVLTPSQQEIFDRAQVGPRQYNGRGKAPIKALQDFGLVDVVWDMRAQAKGNGIELVHVITVTKKEH